MCIVDMVHKQDVLHDNTSLNNLMLHFLRDKDFQNMSRTYIHHDPQSSSK
jgi:hypothetical protein